MIDDEKSHDDARDGARPETGSDADTLPGAPGRSDTPLGDTDQHSDADA
jgi:hypothetical protein